MPSNPAPSHGSCTSSRRTRGTRRASACPQASCTAVTAGGKPYAPWVRAHSETALRSFYDFHRDIGTGPVLNPFPLDRSRRGRRAHAHRNPMDPARNERAGLYRPRVPKRVPRSVPDEEFNEIFARLPSHRDRALVAFYVSTGARERGLPGGLGQAGDGPLVRAAVVVQLAVAHYGVRSRPGRDSPKCPSPSAGSAQTQTSQTQVAQGFTLRKDPRGLPRRRCERLGAYGKGRTRAGRLLQGDFELILVPGRDSTCKFGSDPLTC
jgi:hypothetical protein